MQTHCTENGKMNCGIQFVENFTIAYVSFNKQTSYVQICFKDAKRVGARSFLIKEQPNTILDLAYLSIITLIYNNLADISCCLNSWNTLFDFQPEQVKGNSM